MNTMSKYDYLRLCVRERVGFVKRNWFVKAFTHPVLFDESTDKLTHGDICLKPDGPHAYWDGELYKLTPWETGKLLYNFGDEITITEEDYTGVGEGLETTIGRLLINAIVVPKIVEPRFPYLNMFFPTARTIEQEIADRLVSTGSRTVKEGNVDKVIHLDPNGSAMSEITPDEMFMMLNGLDYIDTLSTLINTATTAKTIARSPGSKEYRDKLIAEAGDSISDESVIIDIENKLLAYDREYLKDDPVAQNVFTGKSELGRSRMYNLLGKQSDFIEDPNNDTTILTSVSDGMSTDPKELVKAINGLRYGFYARGNRTALGGADYKKLQRALTSIEISDAACDTKRGLPQVIRKSDLQYMHGRSILINGEWRVLPQAGDLSSLLGKTVIIRSTMFCTSPGDTNCYACMSERYRNLPEGMTNVSSTISSHMLNMFMKMMHGTKTSLVEVDKEDVFN